MQVLLLLLSLLPLLLSPVLPSCLQYLQQPRFTKAVFCRLLSPSLLLLLLRLGLLLLLLLLPDCDVVATSALVPAAEGGDPDIQEP